MLNNWWRQQYQEKCPLQHIFIFGVIPKNVITFIRMWSFFTKKDIVNLRKICFLPENKAACALLFSAFEK